MNPSGLVSKLLARAGLLFLGLPAFVLVAWLGGWLLSVAVLLIMLVSLSEYYSALYRRGLRPSAAVGFLASILLVIAAANPDPVLSWVLTALVLGLTVALSLIIQMARPGCKDATINAATTVLGVVYLALMSSFLIRLRGYDLPQMVGFSEARGFWHATGALLLVLAPVWCLDTSAFIAGNAWGKRRLAPTVSPYKTVEGALGGFVGCVVATVAIGIPLQLPWVHALAIGAIVGVVAQLGDLSKSTIKRDVGIKDFGELFGPHGGMIDRFDGVMYSAPAVYAYLVLFVGAPWYR